MEYQKFREVAQAYSQRFQFDPYYATLIPLLQKYLGNAQHVLEIGAANGHVPELWDQARRESPEVSKPDNLIYHSVEPVEEAVAIARQKAAKMGFTYLPQVGTLFVAPDASSLQDKSLDGLVISRAFHEMYLDYGKEGIALRRDLTSLLERKQPGIFVYADVEPFFGLTFIETEKFRKIQENEIGHSHDPALDYLPLSFLMQIVAPLGYTLVEEEHLAKPVKGFDHSPWRFVLAVFKK